MHRKKVLAVVAVLALASLSGIALASTADGGASDATLSEEDARQIAENETNGTAQEVEFEQEEEGPVYEVLVDADGELKEVEIDGDTGDVLEVEAEDEEDEEEDEEDEEEDDDYEDERNA